jgi:hypothetical protein
VYALLTVLQDKTGGLLYPIPGHINLVMMVMRSIMTDVTSYVKLKQGGIVTLVYLLVVLISALKSVVMDTTMVLTNVMMET